MSVAGIIQRLLAGKLNPDDWNRIADGLAQEAHEQRSSARRGLYLLDLRSTPYGRSVLIYHNSNPYTHYPQGREEELLEFRKELQKRGLPELGEGSYPPAGVADEGYTIALIIDAGESMLDPLRHEEGHIVGFTRCRLLEAHD